MLTPSLFLKTKFSQNKNKKQVLSSSRNALSEMRGPQIKMKN